MTIKEITNEDWDRIVELESDAYSDIEPESMETLRSKWVASPDLCFVVEKDKEIAGYLLAHPWNSLEPPSLFKPLPERCSGNILFIHDLVVAKEYSGLGLGKAMVKYLLNKVSSKQFESALLVAVQNSQSFWEKFGFYPLQDHKVNSCYGAGAVLMRRQCS